MEADALRLKQVRGGATNYIGALGVDRVSIGAMISKTTSVCCWTLANGMATTLPVSLCLIPFWDTQLPPPLPVLTPTTASTGDSESREERCEVCA